MFSEINVLHIDLGKYICKSLAHDPGLSKGGLGAPYVPGGGQVPHTPMVKESVQFAPGGEVHRVVHT